MEPAVTGGTVANARHLGVKDMLEKHQLLFLFCFCEDLPKVRYRESYGQVKTM